MLCCSCKINQNMVFQLLKNFKVEINFQWSNLDKNIFWLFANRLATYIRKFQRISASSSKGVKFLIKELLYTHIANHIFPSISWLVATWKYVNSSLTSTVNKANHMPVTAPFVIFNVFCNFFSYTGWILVGKQISLC